MDFCVVVFSHWVVSDSLQPHGLQLTRLLCPPLCPRGRSNLCPLSLWCYLIILFSASCFSSCLCPFSVNPYSARQPESADVSCSWKQPNCLGRVSRSFQREWEFAQSKGSSYLRNGNRAPSIAGDCKQGHGASPQQSTPQLETEQGSSLCASMEGSTGRLPKWKVWGSDQCV